MTASLVRDRKGMVSPGFALLGVLHVLLLALLLWGLLLVGIYAYGRQDHAGVADVIVVLGAAQYDGRPSPVLRARLDHAVALYNRGIAPVMITTGGVGAGDTVSEAVVGRRYAIRLGVPAEAVFTERSGLRTIESLRAVADLMSERDLETAVLVSDPFHALRLRILAARVGIRASTSPTRTSPISEDRVEEWRHIFRESGIILWMLIPDDP
jgi:uncharacterized SAM-binding protein YcdF (DUF218 family)